MHSVDETLAKLGDARVFSKLDANSGFWQLPLDDESKRLTTFITNSGRYVFNRLPFGISSAPEIFQRTMSEILQEQTGVVCHMDDMLVFAADAKQHDERLNNVLTKLQASGITLNEAKCEFKKTSIRFLGQIIDGAGVHADPRKTEVIRDFPQPTNVHELRRFAGMVNQLGKFVPNMAHTMAPLCSLLKSDVGWNWDTNQSDAFREIKRALMSSPTLAPYATTR